MTRRKMTRGQCAYCGREMTKGGLTRHLADCPQRQAIIAAANSKSGKEQPIFHLQVQDANDGNFWLHLEMNGSATLKELDKYLRAIWLECCGHLSEFSYGDWDADPIAMSAKAEKVFQPGLQLTHIYDFGTSSETKITVHSVRQGKPTTKHPIALMARNDMPEEICMECDQPAAWYCAECRIEEEKSGMLCDEHVEEHPHENYGEPIALVNSPRLGMCGYDGPATPPY